MTADSKGVKEGEVKEVEEVEEVQEAEEKQIPRFARDDIVCVAAARGRPHPHLIAEECASD